MNVQEIDDVTVMQSIDEVSRDSAAK